MKIERNESDETIDRVLQGLAGVEPPADFERRVLQSVAQRTAEQQRVVRVLPLPWLRSTRWAVAVGLVVLGISMSVAMRKRHESGPGEAVRQQHATPVTAAAPVVGLTAMQPEGTPRRTVFAALPHRQRATKPEVSDEDALAISEMLAPSKPAPPLPLTHQEQMLAEAVHRAAPEELSSLRPEVRARQMELSKAEFRNFFESPPTKDNE